MNALIFWKLGFWSRNGPILSDFKKLSRYGSLHAFLQLVEARVVEMNLADPMALTSPEASSDIQTLLEIWNWLLGTRCSRIIFNFLISVTDLTLDEDLLGLLPYY